ncbi:MAG: hypothetical protein IKJ33_00980 [Clostridia bacterium]|nr:hypothetical protein [Clostridia bacterium]
MEKIEFENNLLEAIKKDDLKSFSLLMPTNADLNLCYGRFPILSLLYLYSSFKILSKFEKALLPIHNFRVVEERNEIYKKFKARAKKSIRFFSNDEIVFPVLMLGVLNEREILKHNFKFLYKNAEIVDKLKKIYKINYYFNVKVEDNSVKIPSSKVSLKQTLLFSIVSIICCLFISLSFVLMGFIKRSVGLGNDKNPIKISTKQEFLSALKYGKRTYLLEDDIEIDGTEFLSKNFSGTILGGGNTVSVSGEIKTPLIKDLSGKIENLKIELNNNEIKITQNFGILAENSSGKVENCEIFGNFVGDFNSTEEIFAGAIVSKNTGEIIDSKVAISSTLTNSNQSNAYFGGIAGLNENKILNCFVKPGIISADTVDISGVACQNYGEILDVENRMTLIQTSNKEWHPNIAGVSIANYGKILNSKNYAELNASSLTADDTENNYFVFIGGIACENYGEIGNCRNYGNIFTKGEIANIVSGGIVAQNIDNEEGKMGTISSSLSKSNLTALSNKGQVCVGGVVGLNATSVVASGFIGTIDAESTATTNKKVFVSKIEKFAIVFAGGVVGISQYSLVKDCYAETSYLANGEAIQTNDDSKPLKLYTGIIASIGVYGYVETELINPFNPSGRYKTEALSNIDGNYYVEKDEIEYDAYGVYAETIGGTIEKCSLTAMTAELVSSYAGENNKTFNKVAKLQDIPLEVIYE